MTLRPIEPGPGVLHGQFSRDLEPALTVTSGDSVRHRTFDVAWGTENHREDDSPRQKFGPPQPPRDDGPCLVGPVAVQGAMPGDMLEVHIEAVVPGAWGWTLAGEIGFFNTTLNRALGVTDGPPRITRWQLDPDALVGKSHRLGRPVATEATSTARS